MNKTRMTSRLLASVLCLVMMLGMTPVIAAAEPDGACDHGNHTSWGTAMGGSFRPRGNVKLTGDVILDSTVSVYGELHICLNGYKITGNADPFFEIGKSGKLTICDCKGGGGIGTMPANKGEYTSAKTTFIKMDSGEFILNGGYLAGNDGQSSWGGAVQLTGGTFTMNGGAITGNSTLHYGGGFSLEGTASFVMNGGTVSENASGLSGGAFATNSPETSITINGGTFCNNVAAANGGVYFPRLGAGKVTINGGTFSDNVASSNGGVFYIGNTLTINGGEFINNVGGNGGVIYGHGLNLVLTGGKFAGNTAKDGPSNIVLDSDGVNTLDVSGSAVVDEGSITGKATTHIHDLKDGASVYSDIPLSVPEGDDSVILGESGKAGVMLYTSTPPANRGIAFDVEQTEGFAYDAEKNELKVPEGTGKTTKLTPKAIDNSGADLSRISWQTSDPAVATVKDGVVTYKGWGRAVITGSIPGTDLFATINVWVDSSALKVLAVGNESTRDTLYYLGALGQAAGTPIIVGYLHHKEAVLRDHDYLMETGSTYRYYKSDLSGKLTDQGSRTVPDTLADESWDVVVLQNGLLHAGVRTTFNSDLEYMVDYMEDKAPDTKLLWNMTWALKDDIFFESMGVRFKDTVGHYDGYEGSQPLMYNCVIDCLDAFITGKNAPYNSANPNNYGTGEGWGFDGWLYTGAAIQYLRQQTGKEPTHDGVYLDGVTGRLTAAVAALNVLMPSVNLDKLADNADLIKAVNAMKNDADGGVSGSADLTAAALKDIVSAVKAAQADAADGQLEKLPVPAEDIKKQSPYTQFTVGREDGPLRLRFPNVQKVGDEIIVIAQRNISHAISGNDETRYHNGSSEVVVWKGKENFTSEQWQQSYLNPSLLINEYQLQQWGAIPGGGVIYDRYQAAKEGKVGYMYSGAGDMNMVLANIDMTGDGVKDEVLLLTFWSNYFKNVGNGTWQDARATYLTYSMDGGDTWATPQWICAEDAEPMHGHMKHGDIAVYDDGNILVPFYYGSGVTAVANEYRFDTAAKQWVQIGGSRPITRPQDSIDEYPSSDGWNEPTVISPDGKTTYALARRTGHVQVSYDRGKTWTLLANEPGFMAQPRFIVLADDLLMGSWQITTGNKRGGVAKLFYTDADWTDTHTQEVYITPETGGDLGDQGIVELSDGRIFSVNYDVRYSAIVGNIIDPFGKDFDKYKPIEVDKDEGEQTLTVDSVADVKLPYTAKEKVTGSHTVSADVTFTSADGKVVIDTSAGVVTVPYTGELALNQSAKVTVSVVGKYMYTRVTQGSYDSGWVSNHGDGSGTKTGISGTGITVKNAAVTRQVIIELTPAVVASVGDAPRQLECSILPALEGYTYRSANENVATVSSTGLVSFVGEGSTEILVELGSVKKACKVTVRPTSPELTGAGKTMVIVDDDFESTPTYAGDNTYALGDSPVNVDANNWYSFKSGADSSKMVIESEDGDQYLKLNTYGAWLANTQDIVGDYTVQFDIQFQDRNLVYLNLWQTSNTGSLANEVDCAFLLMSWGIKLNYTNSAGVSMAYPEGTTSSFIAFKNGCSSDVSVEKTWVRVKVLRTEGAIYMKTWNRDYAEPAEWNLKVADAAMKVDNVGHWKLSGNGSGEYKLDNVKITKQLLDGAAGMADLDPTAWYYDSVDHAINNSIMSGYNAYTFGPNDTLTRAMVVQVLYNKEGQPALNGLKNNFSDVPATQWYNNAVTWGVNKGVTSGYGGNVFKPDQAVSIQELAVFLHNYSGKPAGNGDLSKVPGHDSWAAPALKWAVEQGLLDGMPFGKITDKATRAQTAYMLMKFLNK